MKSLTSLFFVLLIVCFAILAGCTSSSNASPAYVSSTQSASAVSSTDHWQAKIIYSGAWQGALGYNNNVKSISGTGTQTFEIPTPGYFISINAQKKDNSANTLTVQIIKNGNIVATENTDSPYGVAMTSTSVK